MRPGKVFSAGALNEALSTWQGEGGEVSHVPWARAQERGKDCVFFSFPNHAGPGHTPWCLWAHQFPEVYPLAHSLIRMTG